MFKTTKIEANPQYIGKRKMLRQLSNSIKKLVDLGEYESINKGILDFYKKENSEIKEFKTFAQWKEEGATVKRGEKAFLLWGQPRKLGQENEEEQGQYWPLCYLFANTQVYKREAKPAQERQENQPAMEYEPINGDDL